MIFKIKHLLLCVLTSLFLTTSGQQPRISFWDNQQKGTNYFNAVPTREWFGSAAAANIKFVRLAYEKWKSSERDFLIGNADEYRGIVEPDFQKLLHFLDIADSLNIKIVLTPISLPGARWVQSNNGVRDGRLWKEEKYQQQAFQFWRDLATRLKNHPAIVGYNIQNEPNPEVFFGNPSFWKKELKGWYPIIKGTPADLNRFYSGMVKAIRETDKETPIIIEPGLYATPWAFEYLERINGQNIIYSFHMYEPYHFTTHRINNNRFQYPGKIPVEDLGIDFEMNKNSLKEFLNPVVDWAKKNNIPANRIWAGEFGCSRKVAGSEKYLSDLIEIFNENGWHWSFYSYREDVWDSMDYELGVGNLHPKYWEYSSAKTLHLHYPEIYGQGKNNPIWPVFQKEFETN
ncbi:MAG: hypothetical protein FD181_820 [Prolixibacteraceae bacterium]|nr:MAG: hypothetical protein FD181_820 [Prolixibacteraceae bacterium]